MLLETGNKLLIAHRRLFEHDNPRYFVGEVLAYEDGIAKVSGYSFVRDIASSELLRKEDSRIKLVPLASDAFIVYQLPDEVDTALARFGWLEGGLWMTTPDGFRMNLAEMPHRGKI